VGRKKKLRMQKISGGRWNIFGGKEKLMALTIRRN
jgi:hypothetical protein